MFNESINNKITDAKEIMMHVNGKVIEEEMFEHLP